MGAELLGLLLSTGGAALLWAIVQSWRALRQGALADEKDQLDVADERRRTAEIERDAAISIANYWRSRAGVLEYLLAKHVGAEIIPTFPSPPTVTSLVDTPVPRTEQIKDLPDLPDLLKGL